MGTLGLGTLPGHFTAVVLDMDGLLVDTEPLWTRAKEVLFARHGTAFGRADQRAVFGRDDLFTAEYLVRRFALDPAQLEPVRLEYLEEVRRLFDAGIPIHEGALELLTSLRERGVPLALASNTTRMLVDVALERTGIGALLDAVVTPEDAEPKPAPGIYLEACRRLGVDPTTAAALEDSPAGITAAKAAGLTCIAVPSDAHADVSHADRVVTSLLDLLEDPASAAA